MENLIKENIEISDEEQEEEKSDEEEDVEMHVEEPLSEQPKTKGLGKRVEEEIELML